LYTAHKHAMRQAKRSR